MDKTVTAHAVSVKVDHVTMRMVDVLMVVPLDIMELLVTKVPYLLFCSRNIYYVEAFPWPCN